MIFGNLNNTRQNELFDEHVKECLRYALEHELAAMEAGITPLRGDELVLHIVNLHTQTPGTPPWEAHKYHSDIHLVLRGEERIDISFLADMAYESYDEQRDFMVMKGEGKASMILKPGDFVVCYPEDVHIPGLCVTAPMDIKKAVFKLRA